jgi:hypothetical protein
MMTIALLFLRPKQQQKITTTTIKSKEKSTKQTCSTTV